MDRDQLVMVKNDNLNAVSSQHCTGFARFGKKHSAQKTPAFCRGLAALTTLYRHMSLRAE